VPLHHPVVVQAQEREDVRDVLVGRQRAGSHARVVGSDGVRRDPARRAQLRADRLREREVGDPVAVQVADLAPAHPHRALAALTPRLVHAWPGQGRGEDDLARRRYR
jgi:hypothetical protein